MSDDPDWEKAKHGCYYHAWYRHLGYDPDDKYTVHCEYKPKIDDTPPGALELAADAMGEWAQLSSCPTCGQPAWDRDAKICRNCGVTEQEMAVPEKKECECYARKCGPPHAIWCPAAGD